MSNRSAYDRRYYMMHRERKLAYQREWYQRNKDRAKAYQKMYYHERVKQERIKVFGV